MIPLLRPLSSNSLIVNGIDIPSTDRSSNPAVRESELSNLVLRDINRFNILLKNVQFPGDSINISPMEWHRKSYSASLVGVLHWFLQR